MSDAYSHGAVFVAVDLENDGRSAVAPYSQEYGVARLRAQLTEKVLGSFDQAGLS